MVKWQQLLNTKIKFLTSRWDILNISNKTIINLFNHYLTNCIWERGDEFKWMLRKPKGILQTEFVTIDATNMIYGFLHDLIQQKICTKKKLKETKLSVKQPLRNILFHSTFYI